MMDNYRFGYAVVLWDLKSDGFCHMTAKVPIEDSINGPLEYKV